jgi:conjugative transfer signal peptidase TraF
MAAYFAAMATIITAFIHPQPRLIWNASASVPVGLYRLRPSSSPKVGELVAVLPPKALGAYLADRHYLPLDVPMLKHVAAVAGQRVCRAGTRITVDGKYLGDARDRDRRGRALPIWDGCRSLSADDIFLMNPDVPDSFDGRYFGPLPTATIVGRLSPIWIPRADAAPKSTR